MTYHCVGHFSWRDHLAACPKTPLGVPGWSIASGDASNPCLAALRNLAEPNFVAGAYDQAPVGHLNDLRIIFVIIDQYELQIVPEARFVRVIDKWTPVLVHFNDKGVTVRSYTNPQKLVDDYKVHAERIKKEYPDFKELVAVREELTRLVGKHLF